MSIFISILMFGVIVVIHELGHMLVAKKNGIYVKEFWVGFGPTIFSLKKGETKYCLKIIPLGGACVFEEDFAEEGHVPSERSFLSASVAKRIDTVLAGPVSNLILAFVFSLIVLSIAGYSDATLYEIVEGSPAERAGLQAGDVIVKMDHERIHLYDEVLLNTVFNRGEAVNITYERNGERHSVEITPEYSEEAGRYLFGVIGGQRTEGQTVLSTIQYSFYNVNYSVKNVFKSFLSLFRGRIKVEDVSGVVGVTAAMSDLYEESRSYGALIIALNMLSVAILVSANVGIFNLFPIPGLDGGKLLFYIVEIIRRKPADKEIEAKIQLAGFALMLLMVVFITYNDILKLIK
ncbi:MAG: M50 family metallopeptidase [Lachnospiraceae bacterium]|nr:M50 family metallopeptidase [Lachnospiraceae bacterium]